MTTRGRALAAGILAGHGLIHLVGFVASWHMAAVTGISQCPTLVALAPNSPVNVLVAIIAGARRSKGHALVRRAWVAR